MQKSKPGVRGVGNAGVERYVENISVFFSFSCPLEELVII
jgi:hypothetical protein